MLVAHSQNKERIKKIKETRDSRYIYQNELDKACFQHYMAYGDFKDLNKRTAADEVLRKKPLNIAKDPKYDGYQQGLAPVVYKLFDKKNSNKELAEALHKPIIINFDEMKSTLPIYNA